MEQQVNKVSRPEIQTAIVQITAFPLLVGVALTSAWALERGTGRQKNVSMSCSSGTTPPQLRSRHHPHRQHRTPLSNWSETQQLSRWRVIIVRDMKRLVGQNI